MFASRVVALYHEVECDPRSLDLTSCNFFFWGYLKSKIFVTPPRDMQDLQNRILIGLKNVRQISGMIHNAVRSMQKRTQNMADMLNKTLQKQSPMGVRQNSSTANMQKIYRRTPMWKCDFNNVAMQLY